jgi:non-ribosomal peptide synthetase component F
MFTPLTLGAAISVPGGDDMESPRRLVEWMRRERVSVAHLTPAMGQFLSATADESAGALGALRRAFFVGDVLTVSDVTRLHRLAPSVTCINYYGTTETQRAVGHFVVPRGEVWDGKEVLPLGRGIEDVQLLVLDGAQRLAGVGEVGEVYVRSPHLARGYIGDPALTEERFITNQLTGDPADRLYRTGDLGRYLPDGNVEPLGRADLQVKIRGFRVELKEIEAVLAAHEAVRDVAVIAREDVAGERRLVAYVVGRPERAPVGGELRAYLKGRLPEYMIPAAFVALDALPLTPNGKLDRRALPAPDRARPETSDGFVAPRNSTEAALAEIWAEVLSVETVGVEDNFFDLGGHSLLVIQVLSRVRRSFHVEVPLRELFESPTVAALAVSVVQHQAAQADLDEMHQLLAELEQLSEEEVPLLAERREEGSSPD